MVSLGAIFLLVSFGLILFNQFLQLAEFLYGINPILGQSIFVLLTVFYLGIIIAPILIYMSMPKALPTPPLEGSPQYKQYLKKLTGRLRRNVHLKDYNFKEEDRENIKDAVIVLDTQSEKEIKDTAQKVFIFTSISQYGRLDGLIVLVILFRLTLKVALIYNQRPSFKEIINLYLNVFATVLLVSEMDNLEMLETQLEPVLEEVGAAATLAAGTANLSNIVANSIIQGAANSFLTLRVGCIAKHYSSPLSSKERKGVLHSATLEASRMLGKVLTTCVSRLTRTIIKAGQKAVWGRVIAGKDKVFRKAGDFFSYGKKAD